MAERRTRQAQAPEAFRTAYGHFADGGRTYVITRPDTPRPWINILCNGSYGALISQAGGGFSWWENANLARLTSWTQDLIRDESGKFLYVRDDESGQVWSAAWKPVCAPFEHYEARHTIGSTTITQRCQGIETRWTLLVPPEDPVEIWRVRVRNTGNRPRRISLYSYLEWCLGNGIDWHREFQKTFIETAWQEPLRALIGQKRKLPIPSYISTGMTELPLSGFHAVNRPVTGYEGSKEDFLGRYRTFQSPKALQDGKLTNTVGKWYDSIASLQVSLALQPGQEEEVIFLLGKHDTLEATETLVHRYAIGRQVDEAQRRVEALWQPFLEHLEIETPDAGMNYMVNGWLKYQAICGRIWAKTAYYQSSAAYGYRDQLQDSHVFLPLKPELTRQQILLHAAQQFKDGAVRHWWFSVLDTGPRTGKTDDLLWLVFLTLSYIDETDDLAILRERARFLDGGSGILLEHCRRSLQQALSRFSRRGLPLLGEGDWNDGLSAAGAQWKGESLWLGHFLYHILQRWSALLERLKTERPVKLPGVTAAALATQIRAYRRRATALKTAINTYGWDGQWYWYATRDNGDFVGSRRNTEGRMHLNAQTWAVIAGTGTPQRIQTAMASVEQQLHREYGPLLLTPAYAQPDDTIGYLSRYAPGIRENGGVYSHGAMWAIMAECMLGRADVAYAMFSQLCPPKRGMDPELYAVEPYVTPGNTDGPETPFFGRGGWTWYTGSAAWLFRVTTEWLLGVRPTRQGLVIAPCIPAAWDGFRMRRLFRGALFEIVVENPQHVSGGVREMWLDGQRLAGSVVPPQTDGREHQVRVVLGR